MQTFEQMPDDSQLMKLNETVVYDQQTNYRQVFDEAGARLEPVTIPYFIGIITVLMALVMLAIIFHEALGKQGLATWGAAVGVVGLFVFGFIMVLINAINQSIRSGGNYVEVDRKNRCLRLPREHIYYETDDIVNLVIVELPDKVKVLGVLARASDICYTYRQIFVWGRFSFKMDSFWKQAAVVLGVPIKHL